MKIQSPWMGRIKGSAGNMTGCKIYDKNVMRAKAFEVNNPNTAAQQVQRGYFDDLSKLVASFTPEQLRTLFPNKPKAMSRRNALTKQLAEYNVMDGTEKIVDFANIDTFGNAPTMNVEVSQISFEEVGLINAGIDWLAYNNNLPENLRQIVAFVNVTKKEISLTNQSCGLDETFVFSVPTTWEVTDQIHQIPMLTSATQQNASFGSFIIKVRPEKKSN